MSVHRSVSVAQPYNKLARRGQGLGACGSGVGSRPEGSLHPSLRQVRRRPIALEPSRGACVYSPDQEALWRTNWIWRFLQAPREGADVSELWSKAYPELRQLARARLRPAGAFIAGYHRAGQRGLHASGRDRPTAVRSPRPILCLQRPRHALNHPQLGERGAGGATWWWAPESHAVARPIADELRAEEDPLRIDDALCELAKVEPRLAAVVEMRFLPASLKPRLRKRSSCRTHGSPRLGARSRAVALDADRLARFDREVMSNLPVNRINGRHSLDCFTQRSICHSMSARMARFPRAGTGVFSPRSRQGTRMRRAAGCRTVSQPAGNRSHRGFRIRPRPAIGPYTWNANWARRHERGLAGHAQRRHAHPTGCAEVAYAHLLAGPSASGSGRARHPGRAVASARGGTVRRRRQRRRHPYLAME